MENCIFCKIVNGDIPSAVVYEDENFRAIMDIAPAAKGHVILLSKAHMKDLTEADDAVLSAALPVVKRISNAIKKTLSCDGINVLQNNGTAAGQSVFHLHIHMIPRYDNDGVTVPWEQKSYADGEAAELAKKIAANL
ncbi:MAG: HIT family protein [Lachnospiraceae bacterium]|nr:HIT family protein [Lachnospiraceae bacterium]